MSRTAASSSSTMPSYSRDGHRRDSPFPERSSTLIDFNSPWICIGSSWKTFQILDVSLRFLLGAQMFVFFYSFIIAEDIKIMLFCRISGLVMSDSFLIFVRKDVTFSEFYLQMRKFATECLWRRVWCFVFFKKASSSLLGQLGCGHWISKHSCVRACAGETNFSTKIKALKILIPKV